MNKKEEIERALAAADQPLMVESATQLKQAASDWLKCDVIGIDTEFVRERTWRADLGLVQLSDGKTVWLVDPLRTGSLRPLSELFDRPDIVKILHAPSEDLDVLLYTTGSCPEPLFDTQLACAMLGESLQMGYHKTVEWLLGITIDKGETRSNWLKRPLRPAQLHYAALDVCLLPMMHQELAGRLAQLDRSNWLYEDSARMVKKAHTPPDPEQSWKRINGNHRLDGNSLSILQRLAKWRDHEAERRNIARGFVIKDTELLSISNHKITDPDELSRLEILHPRVIERYGKTLVSKVTDVLQQNLQATPLPVLDNSQKPLLTSMRDYVQQKAKQLSVDPALLASKKELENLILSAEATTLPRKFQGWREDIIGNELMKLKEQYFEQP